MKKIILLLSLTMSIRCMGQYQPFVNSNYRTLELQVDEPNVKNIMTNDSVVYITYSMPDTLEELRSTVSTYGEVKSIDKGMYYSFSHDKKTFILLNGPEMTKIVIKSIRNDYKYWEDVTSKASRLISIMLSSNELSISY